MTNLWMNLLAVLLTSFSWGSGDLVQNREVQGAESGHFVVIDRIEGEVATLESGDEIFTIPRAALPPEAAYEGMVLEWHISESEIQNRLEGSRDRIRRKQTQSALVMEI